MDDIDRGDEPDDHSDTTMDATPVDVGATVQGAIAYSEDSDFFVFQAEGGQLY